MTPSTPSPSDGHGSRSAKLPLISSSPGKLDAARQDLRPELVHQS
jgi:hypothetical protein